MKERSILFSGPMVRGILEGRKTQTRRVLKPQPTKVAAPVAWMAWEPGVTAFRRRQWGMYVEGAIPGRWGLNVVATCPYGVPGDRLWVREAHAWMDRHLDGFDREEPVVVGYKADGALIRHEWSTSLRVRRPIPDNHMDDFRQFRWRSPVHMPRWASRITLEVTDVRVERVQDISEDDAWAEGIYNAPSYDDFRDEAGEPNTSCVAHFRLLWDSINAKRGYPWESNPWVWCVTFRKLDA